MPRNPIASSIDLPQNESECDIVVSVVAIDSLGIDVVNLLKLQPIYRIRKTIAICSDAAVLSKSLADLNIQLDEGNRAEENRRITCIHAKSRRAEIQHAMQGSHMVFIVTGAPGSPGNAVAQMVAKLALELGALTLVLADLYDDPAAEDATWHKKWLQQMRKRSDCVVRRSNLTRKPISISSGTQHLIQGNEITQSLEIVTGLSQILNNQDLVGLDLEDVRTILGGEGKLIMYGRGLASGPDRALTAIRQAIESDRMKDTLAKTDGLIFWIGGAGDIKLGELRIVVNEIRTHSQDECTIVFGTFDSTLLLTGEMEVGMLVRTNQ